MREKIEEYIKSMHPMGSVGKWLLAEAVDHRYSTWDSDKCQQFEKDLTFVIKKLKKEGLKIGRGAGWVHRQGS